MDLHAVAALLAGHAAAEARLHAILGGWAADEADPQVRLLLAEQSHHHGWHAGLLAERVPVVDPPEAPPGPPPAVEVLASCEGTLERLVGADVVVVPERAAAYEAEIAGLNPLSDGPAIRALTLIVADQRRDMAAGRALARSLAGDDLVASTADALRRRWAAAG